MHIHYVQKFLFKLYRYILSVSSYFVVVLPQYALVKSGLQDYCCRKRDLVIFTNYILTNILELSAKCHENLVNFFFEYYFKWKVQKNMFRYIMRTCISETNCYLKLIPGMFARHHFQRVIKNIWWYLFGTLTGLYCWLMRILVLGELGENRSWQIFFREFRFCQVSLLPRILQQKSTIKSSQRPKKILANFSYYMFNVVFFKN